MSLVLKKKYYLSKETNEECTVVITNDRDEFAFRMDTWKRPTAHITFGLRIWNKLKRAVVSHTHTHGSWICVGSLAFMVHGGEDRVFIEVRQTDRHTGIASLNLPREIWDQVTAQQEVVVVA